MWIETSRFGRIEIDEFRIITFEEGILGFPHWRQYALMQPKDDSAFLWLQCVERADLAFVVCDPRTFLPDYTVPVKREEVQSLSLSEAEQGQVFVIVNKVENLLTGNLQGPLVVNVQNRQGRQIVLSDKRYSTRHPLMRLDARQALSKTA